MYLKEMGSVPLLTREEEVEISKRIEKAQMQVERIIMRFRYSTRESISIANYLLSGKERFDSLPSSFVLSRGYMVLYWSIVLNIVT